MTDEYLIQSARDSIKQMLSATGEIEYPTIEDEFEDEDQQKHYEKFITYSKHYLKYLETEGFVKLQNNKYVLRLSDDLTAEVEALN